MYANSSFIMNATSCMDKSPRTTLRLDAGETAAVPVSPGTAVCCVFGLVRVTPEGSSHDYLLPHGLCFVAASACNIRISGIGDGSIVETGAARVARTRALAYQPLRIDWARVAQIEHAARRARAEHLASMARAIRNFVSHAFQRFSTRQAGNSPSSAFYPSGDKS